MPTLPDILRQLQFISQEWVLLGLFITAGLILIGRDWRLLILTLLVQYILAGLFLTRLVRPDIAVLQVMIGAFICPILFLSARQVSTGTELSLLTSATTSPRRSHWWQLPDADWLWGGESSQRLAPTGTIFRLFLVLLVALVAVTLARSFPLPEVSQLVTIAVYWLILTGLVILTLTEYPLKVGHGLFTLLIGFGIYYATLESSLLLIGLWGAVKLLLALAIGYLTVVRSTGPEERLS